MPDDTNELLLELQTRARVAHDLAVMLVSLRTEDGWRADALIDDCLDRLQRQLSLLIRGVNAMCPHTPARGVQPDVKMSDASALKAQT
jgi:hypothetical protein